MFSSRCRWDILRHDAWEVNDALVFNNANCFGTYDRFDRSIPYRLGEIVKSIGRNERLASSDGFCLFCVCRNDGRDALFCT